MSESLRNVLPVTECIYRSSSTALGQTLESVATITSVTQCKICDIQKTIERIIPSIQSQNEALNCQIQNLQLDAREFRQDVLSMRQEFLSEFSNLMRTVSDSRSTIEATVVGFLGSCNAGMMQLAADTTYPPALRKSGTSSNAVAREALVGECAKMRDKN